MSLTKLIYKHISYTPDMNKTLNQSLLDISELYDETFIKLNTKSSTFFPGELDMTPTDEDIEFTLAKTRCGDIELYNLYKKHKKTQLVMPEYLREPKDFLNINIFIFSKNKDFLSDRSRCSKLLSLFDIDQSKINRFTVTDQSKLTEYSLKKGRLKIHETEKDMTLHNIFDKYKAPVEYVKPEDLASALHYVTKSKGKIKAYSPFVDLRIDHNDSYPYTTIFATIRTPRPDEINKIDTYIKELTHKSMSRRGWYIESSDRSLNL